MAHNSDVVCPTCGANVAIRINRAGFMQQNVLWRFGVYPWKCGGCGVTFLSRKRGEKPRRRRGDNQPEGAEPQERRGHDPTTSSAG